MIRVILIGGILFVASAAASWFLIPKDIIGGASSVESEENTGLVTEPLPPPPEDMLPVAVRPQPMTPEEILRHAASLRAREQSLDAREQIVEQRESELKLIEIDIRGERQELEGLRDEIRSDTDALEELLQQTLQERQGLQQERDTASQELQAFDQRRATFDEDKRQNLKDLAEMLTPDTAARVIREFVNDGQTDMAVQLLANFEERQASQILEAIEDTALIQELAEKFASLKRPETRSRRR